MGNSSRQQVPPGFHDPYASEEHDGASEEEALAHQTRHDRRASTMRRTAERRREYRRRTDVVNGAPVFDEHGMAGELPDHAGLSGVLGLEGKSRGPDEYRSKSGGQL